MKKLYNYINNNFFNIIFWGLVSLLGFFIFICIRIVAVPEKTYYECTWEIIYPDSVYTYSDTIVSCGGVPRVSSIRGTNYITGRKEIYPIHNTPTESTAPIRIVNYKLINK